MTYAWQWSHSRVTTLLFHKLNDSWRYFQKYYVVLVRCLPSKLWDISGLGKSLAKLKIWFLPANVPCLLLYHYELYVYRLLIETCAFQLLINELLWFAGLYVMRGSHCLSWMVIDTKATDQGYELDKKSWKGWLLFISNQTFLNITIWKRCSV